MDNNIEVNEELLGVLIRIFENKSKEELAAFKKTVDEIRKNKEAYGIEDFTLDLIDASIDERLITKDIILNEKLETVCPICGLKACGNYCSNCGQSLNKID